MKGKLWSSAKSNRTRLGSSLADADLDGHGDNVNDDNANSKANNIARPDVLSVCLFCIIDTSDSAADRSEVSAALPVERNL